MRERHYRGSYNGTPLKPCPFCGSDAILTVYEGDWASVKCSGENGCIICPATHPHCPTPEAAIYDWNLRGKVIAKHTIVKKPYAYTVRFTYNETSGAVYLIDHLGLEVPFAVLGSKWEARDYVAEAVESFPDMVLHNYDPEGKEVR